MRRAATAGDREVKGFPMSAMKFYKASILLGLLSASCGMLKLNVNGKPYGGGGADGSTAAAPTNPPGQADKTKLALPAHAEQKITRAALTPRLTTPAINVAVDARADDLGFRCGDAKAQGYTSTAPAYSFEVTDAFDLQVRLTETWNGVEGILVFPDGSTQCNESNGKFLAETWPKGTYHLFLVSSGSNAGGRVEFSSAAAASAAAPTITVTQPTSAPQHAKIEQITYVGGYNKVFNDSNYKLECTSSEVSDMPSAYIDFKASTATTRVSVWGRNLNGFVYRFAGKSFIQCGSIAKPPQGGWPTGRVEIYPMGRLNQKGDAFTVVVDDPQTPASDSQVQELVLDGKLASPKFVTVALRDGRWQIPQELLGTRCGEHSFAGITDVKVTLQRPIPGLTIVPLAAASEVKTLLRYPGQSYCTSVDRLSRPGKADPKSVDKLGAYDAPTWASDGVVRFGDKQDGNFELQLGALPGITGSVTLMIFDDSTELSPLQLHKLDAAAIGNREIARAFPQLNIARISARNRTALEMAAQLFATAPREMFVYPKIAMDSDLAKPSYGAKISPTPPLAARGTVPALGEPLLLLDATKGDVLTADGLIFQIAPTYLVATSTAPLAVPTVPRPIAADTRVEALADLLPASSTSNADYRKQVDKFERCKEAAWAPYGDRLPSVLRPGGVEVVVVVNAAYRQIEDAGNRAVIAKCGSDEAFKAKTEKLRVKMLAEFEASRPALLATARAGF